MKTPPLEIKLDAQGLVTAICQDAATGQVLMVAHMNQASIERTFKAGEAVFYSRSREELWHKGATSGSFLHVESAQVDCDGDVLLLQVHADGPACHTGEQSCFFTPLDREATEGIDYQHAESGPGVLQDLYQIIRQRQQERPQGSYTTSLFEAGTSRIAQKVAEEGSELALAAATGDLEHVPAEAADLLYHTLVLLADAGVSPEAVWEELRTRRQ
jgi:phosphoribosyl-ATP pyrophosphohydrolase/phosphoribosyl-AMP cyclohydrolase